MRAYVMAAMVICGGLAVGCSVTAEGGGNDCGNQDALGIGGAGGEGGAGGSSSAGGEGECPVDGPIEAIECAGSLSTWPQPPNAPLGARVELVLPHSRCLVEMRVSVDPAEGHVQIPSVPPSFYLVSNPIADPQDLAVIATATDAPMDLMSYEKAHAIGMQLYPGIWIREDTAYAALAFPEQGEGAVSGGLFMDWICVIR